MHLKDIKEGINTPELNAMGCARLVKAVLANAILQPPIVGKNDTLTDKHNKIRLCDRTIAFADSSLIEHFSTVYEYDQEKISKAIKRVNIEAKHKLIHSLCKTRH